MTLVIRMSFGCHPHVFGCNPHVFWLSSACLLAVIRTHGHEYLIKTISSVYKLQIMGNILCCSTGHKKMSTRCHLDVIRMSFGCLPHVFWLSFLWMSFVCHPHVIRTHDHVFMSFGCHPAVIQTHGHVFIFRNNACSLEYSRGALQIKGNIDRKMDIERFHKNLD